MVSAKPDFLSARPEPFGSKQDTLKPDSSPLRSEFRSQKQDDFSLKRSRDPLNDSL